MSIPVLYYRNLVYIEIVLSQSDFYSENFNISITVTLKLRLTSFVASIDPIYPAPPVIKIFFINYKNFEFLSLILKIGFLHGHLILIFGSFHLTDI